MGNPCPDLAPGQPRADSDGIWRPSPATKLAFSGARGRYVQREPEDTSLAGHQHADGTSDPRGASCTQVSSDWWRSMLGTRNTASERATEPQHKGGKRGKAQ